MKKGLINGFLILILFLSACRLSPSADTVGESSQTRISVRQFHLGMIVELTLYCPDSSTGKGPQRVSEELFALLSLSCHLADLTGGKFDPTTAPLVRLWREARKSGKPVPETEVNQIKELIGYESIVPDREKRTVDLLKPGMLLDLGAIAKGYIGDEVIRLLDSLGMSAASYIAGGDMVFGDPPPGEDGWMIDIPDAGLRRISLSNAAVGISGDSFQHLDSGGRRYSHVVDPVSMGALINSGLCVVRAGSGAVSDALSTIGTLLPEDEFRELVKKHFRDAEIY